MVPSLQMQCCGVMVVWRPSGGAVCGGGGCSEGGAAIAAAQYCTIHSTVLVYYTQCLHTCTYGHTVTLDTGILTSGGHTSSYTLTTGARECLCRGALQSSCGSCICEVEDLLHM